jgi:putative glutamine amidotransferase
MPSKNDKKKARRPKILVLEGLGGSADCVVQAGGDIVEARPHDVAAACSKIDSHDWDGMLLTGGGDVDPRMYGQRPRKEVYGVSENRDLVETYALEVARRLDRPVMGICRGFQIINVEAGGTLRQHVNGHRGTEHAVLSTDRTIFREYAGLSPTVVSLHHQVAERVAPGYEVTAKAADGTIEAIESTTGRVMAVQFHPEMDYMEDYARGLFRWLVSEAATRAGLPVPAPVAKKVEKPYGRSRYHSVSKPPAGSPHLLPRRAGAMSGVKTSWLCPQCALRFDDQGDRDDHVAMLHEGMVTRPSDIFPAERDVKALKRGSGRHGDLVSQLH